MKKAISVLLVMMLVFGLSVTALAASPNGPSAMTEEEIQKAAEELLDNTDEIVAENAEGDTAVLVKDEAVEETAKALVSAGLITEENPQPEFAEVKENIPEGFAGVKAAAVVKAETGGQQTFKVDKETFAGLYQLVDGVWKLIEVELDENGQFVYELEEGETYAIFYGSNDISPVTGESIPYALLIAAVVLAGAAVVFFRKSRKANA